MCLPGGLFLSRFLDLFVIIKSSSLIILIGRVEEVVTGIKGVNCNKVTEEINNALGKVVSTKPTEEMFEQEVVLDQTTQLKNKVGDWEGSSTW